MNFRPSNRSKILVIQDLIFLTPWLSLGGTEMTGEWQFLLVKGFCRPDRTGQTRALRFSGACLARFLISIPFVLLIPSLPTPRYKKTPAAFLETPEFALISNHTS
jgi:hypothetical protein